MNCFMIFFAIFQNFVESIHPAMNPAVYEDIDEENAEEKDVLDVWSEPEPLGVGERLNSVVPEGNEGVCENNITINDDVICNCNICSICRYIMNHCGYRNAKLKGI